VAGLSVYKYAVKFAWNDMLSRKVRATLTVFSIAVGIATLVALMSITLGMRTQVESMLSEALGLAVILSGKTAIEVPVSLVPVVKNIPGVIDAYPVIEHMATIEKAMQPVFVRGVPPDKLLDAFPMLEVKEGRIFQGEEKAILITPRLAERLGLDIGDIVEISPGTVGASGEKYEIIGVVKLGISIGDFIIMPLSKAQELYNRPGYASAIIIKVASRDTIKPLADALREMFPGARIMEPEQIAKQIERIMNVINATLLSIGSISLVVAALSVMNTITMVVRERIREIGILKALGAQRRHVLAIFMSEALLLSIIGGIIGIIMGISGAHAVAEALVHFIGLKLSPVIDLLTLAEGMIIAILVGSIASFHPAWKGANIRPVEALRYE